MLQNPQSGHSCMTAAGIFSSLLRTRSSLRPISSITWKYSI
ncbi:hypothetical protein MASSI9I_40133 [Massilia sp. 9I]|nr:hypothetical protein MASSI9I_40133 [Massilia sp. 9I]